MAEIPPRVLLFTLGPVMVSLTVIAGVTGWHRRALTRRVSLRDRARTLVPYAGVLGLVLAFNGIVRPRVDEFSTAFGLNFTEAIYRFEGAFVAHVQDLTPEPLVVYFSAVYIVGYVVLLAFPPLAYGVLDEVEPVAALLVAYAINYLLGALCYVVVVAHGPRNWRPDLFEAPLYATIPDVRYLTDAVNANTNVFPSLHTSLSVTVLVFAVLTREEYPRWLAIAAVLAPSVVLSTMVLGIHWLTDVLAGIALALISVGLARWTVARVRGDQDASHRPTEPVRF